MSSPLIFFVHVPKTAGSAINAMLKEHEPNGADHQEHLFEDKAALKKAAESFAWMSGHVDFSIASKRLAEATDRPVRFFTCVRDPAKQVASHYNWLIEIFHKSPQFYAGHPPVLREISSVLRAGPFDLDTVIGNLSAYQVLFLNGQSRFVLGSAFDWNVPELGSQLARYEKIATSSEASALVSAMLGRDVDAATRVNESRYHFDPSIFDQPDMRRFLAQWNARDEVLYRMLTTRPI